MNGVAAKLGGFAVVLAVVFGGALGLGAAAGLAVSVPADGPEHEEGGTEMTGHAMTADQPAVGADHGEGAHGGRQAVVDTGVGGLAVSQNGYTFTPAGTLLEAGVEQEYRFIIAGPDGQPVRDYVEEHDKDLHLIVVRRDLSGFQHVHPERDAGGTWSIPLTLTEAGEYRAFADFVPAGGEGVTLGVDLRAAGDYAPQPLPAPGRIAEVDGYTVELSGDLLAATSSDLTFTVSSGGEPVTDLQPYLDAYGHLVALRDGDLAYLHVHPHGEPGDGITPAGPAVEFTAEVPTAGTYRLFLDFQHDGVVRTAEFTVTTVGTGAAAAPAEPIEREPETHDADGHAHEDQR